MDNRQIQLVKESWGFLKVQEPELAEQFYAKLFAVAPQARAMFPDDMAEQKRKFRVTIGTVVNSLGRFEEVENIVRALGKRHVGYGTQSAHYGLVAEALVGTLRDMHGPSWNADLEAAWVGAYTAVATTMQNAASEVSAPSQNAAPPVVTQPALDQTAAQQPAQSRPAPAKTAPRVGWLARFLGLFRRAS